MEKKSGKRLHCFSFDGIFDTRSDPALRRIKYNASLKNAFQCARCPKLTCLKTEAIFNKLRRETLTNASSAQDPYFPTNFSVRINNLRRLAELIKNEIGARGASARRQDGPPPGGGGLRLHTLLGISVFYCTRENKRTARLKSHTPFWPLSRALICGNFNVQMQSRLLFPKSKQ